VASESASRVMIRTLQVFELACLLVARRLAPVEIEVQGLVDSVHVAIAGWEIDLPDDTAGTRADFAVPACSLPPQPEASPLECS
jgi:hypothetical protein